LQTGGTRNSIVPGVEGTHPAALTGVPRGQDAVRRFDPGSTGGGSILVAERLEAD
jgi:hypothetical protein